jgi:carbonic anhydrase/acetyltransferase-like protein (isoleucine patch superfamily)
METSGCKWVVGSGAPLAAALAAWREIAPATRVDALEIVEDGNYVFDLSSLDRMVATSSGMTVTAFVALGAQFMNFRRFELMAALKERGLKLPPLISPGAIVAADATVGENSWIGAGVVLGAGTKIGYNCVIGARAILGLRCVAGNSTWIDAGAILGDDCRIGANAIVGRAVMLDDGVEIGKSSVVDQPGRYTRNIAAKTFIRGDFDEPVIIVGG